MIFLLTHAENKNFISDLIQNLKLSESDVCLLFDRDYISVVNEINTVDYIFIDLDFHTTIDNKSYLGLDLAVDIRSKYKLSNPILFYSHIPKSAEELILQNWKSKILFCSGSKYIDTTLDLPSKVQHWLDSAIPIDEATLYDINTMALNLKGILIERINHDIRLNSTSIYVNSVIDSILPYLTDDLVHSLDIEGFRSRILVCISENNFITFNKEKESFLDKVKVYFEENEEIDLDKSFTPIHKILFIDDKQDELDFYSEKLKDFFIVESVRTSQEALDILSKDESCEIKAVITDWRLYTDDSNTIWQPIQGYTILKYASYPNFRALFALSSQPDKIVHHIRNLTGANFSMFKKNNLNTGQEWQLFIESIHAGCVLSAQLASKRVAGESWYNLSDKKRESLQNQYMKARNQPDWKVFEESISKKSDEIYNYYLSHLEGRNLDSIQSMDKQFSITLKLNLEHTLVMRRVVVGLFRNQTKFTQIILGQEYPRINIYCLLKGINFEDESKKKFTLAELDGKSVDQHVLKSLTNASNALINTALSLGENMSDENQLLPEEIEWLKLRGIVLDLSYEDSDGDEDIVEFEFESKTKFLKEENDNIEEILKIEVNLERELNDSDNLRFEEDF